MALSSSLQSFHAYAQYALSEGMKTSLFKVPTLLAAIASKSTVTGPMGEPGAASVIGKPMSVAKRKSLGGSTQKHIFFQTQRTGGGKYLSEDGTTSSTGAGRQDKNKRSTAISWSFYEQPIAIRNNALRMAGDGYAIGSIVEDATIQAMNEATEQLAGDIWNGSPSSHTADVYDDLIGVDTWLNDSSDTLGTGTLIGTLDRSETSAFDGRNSSTATSVALSTIDDASLANTDGLAVFGSKRDVAVTVPSVYKKLKQEALAAGGQLYFGERPQGAQVGFTGEYINYCNTMLTFDPYAHNTGNTKNYLLIADSSTWCFETHSAENWRVLPFKDLADDSLPGSDDLTVSKIRIGMRWYCEEPWKNFLYDEVS